MDDNETVKPKRPPGYRRAVPLAVLSVLGVLALTVLAYFYLVSGDTSDMLRGGMSLIKRKQETVNRLLTVPLLLYHNIDGHGPYSLPLGALESHFRLFKEKGVRVVSLDGFARRLDHPAHFDGKAVVLSFDDGYPSMYSMLLPLMTAYGYPVTLFVHTNNVFHQARRNLTWTQLREMRGKGLDIQSHSQSHADLVRVIRRGDRESRKRLFDEIYLSKRILELYLGGEVRYFAFPYGSYSLEVVDLCRNAGYARVFSTDYGPNIITRNNYCLRRRHIKSDYTLKTVESLVE